LLDQIRLHGKDPELVDAVVRLSLRYGIATPYTSFLVEEPEAVPMVRAPAAVPGAVETVVVERPVEVPKIVEKVVMATPLAASGAEAVAEAEARKELRVAERAPIEEAKAVRHVGERTFVYRGGIWVDTGYEADKMEATMVPFGSSRYFELAADPEVAGYLALGPQVIFVYEGKAYRVTPSEEVEPEAQATPPVSPSPTPRPTVEQPRPSDASNFWAALLAWLRDLWMALTRGR